MVQEVSTDTPAVGCTLYLLLEYCLELQCKMFVPAAELSRLTLTLAMRGGTSTSLNCNMAQR